MCRPNAPIGERRGRSSAPRPWKRVKRSIRAALVRGLIHVLALLPRAASHALGGAIGWLAWLLSPGLRRDVRANLAVAFPGQGASERDALGRGCLVHLGRLGGEMIALPGRSAFIHDYVRISESGLAVLRKARLRGKGIILVLGHIGNWELTCRLSSELPAFSVIAKRSWHRSLDVLAERTRASNGICTLWRGDPGTGRSMLRVLKAGGALGLLIDQDIASVQSVFVPFFGRAAATPRGAADLALRFGATVLVVTGHRLGPRARDGHRLEITEVPYDPAPRDLEAEVVRLTAACTRIQEEAIRLHPTEWVWMHRRWKTRPVAPEGEDAGQAVPPAANVAVSDPRGSARG